MPVVHVKDFAGCVHVLAAEPGLKLMEIIRDSGLPIEAQCGGGCSCATCHVYIDEAWFPQLQPKGDIEEDMLAFAEAVKPTSRLSCQIVFRDELDGLRIELVPD